MRRSPSDETAQAFAEGFFEVLGALLSAPVSFELKPSEPVTPDGVAKTLAQRPVVIQGGAEDAGAAALLFTVKDGLSLAGMVFGKPEKTNDHLAEHDLATLTELGEHALKRAIERVAAQAEKQFALAETKVTFEGPISDERLGKVLASDALVVWVHFHAEPELDVESVLLLPAGWVTGGSKASEPVPVETQEADKPAEWDAVQSDLNPKKELGMAPEMDMGLGRPIGASVSNTANLDMVLDIRLVVRARLGRVELPVGDILALGPGSIVDVGRMLDEPVEVLVNDKLIARGDVVVVDEKFGLRITEIVSPRERIESLR